MRLTICISANEKLQLFVHNRNKSGIKPLLFLENESASGWWPEHHCASDQAVQHHAIVDLFSYPALQVFYVFTVGLSFFCSSLQDSSPSLSTSPSPLAEAMFATLAHFVPTVDWLGWCEAVGIQDKSLVSIASPNFQCNRSSLKPALIFL